MVNLDLVFVLDSSGSIGTVDYETVKQFVYNFTSNLDVGSEASRIGVIIYSDEAQVEFSLSQHTAKNETLEAIRNIAYLGQLTNTPDGLCTLIDMLDSEARNDSGVFKLAIVMTDGRSNRHSVSFINCTSVSEAATRLHAMFPELVVYVIGVTSNVDEMELEAIASSPANIEHIDSFGGQVLQNTQDQFAYQICVRGKLHVVIFAFLGCFDTHNYNDTLLLPL